MTYLGQEMIVTESCLFKKNPIHNINIVFKILNHDFENNIFKKVFHEFTKFHEVLYYKIEKDENESSLKKIDKPNVDLVFKEVSFSNEDALKKQINSLVEVPLLTVNPALLRLIVLKNNNNKYMLLSMHHSICDLKSIETFIHDLDDIYAILKQIKNNNLDFEEKEIVEIENLRSKYAKKNYSLFGDLHKEWCQSEQAQESKNYWKKALSGISLPLAVSTDFHRLSETINYNTKIVDLHIDGEVYIKCKSLSSELNVNLFEIFHSVFKYFVYSISNKKEFVITTPATLRRLGSFNHTLGYFSNLLPIPCHINLESSVKEFILENKKSLSDSIKHKNFPYSKICQMMKVGRGSKNGETYDEFRFVYQRIGRENASNAPHFATGKKDNRLDMNAFSFKNMDYSNGYGLHEFSMMLFDCSTDVVGKIEYRVDLFKQETIDTWLKSFSFILEQFMNNLENKLKDIQFTERENFSVLYPEDFYPKGNARLDKCLDKLFEESVENFPDNIAIKYLDSELSYRDLNKISNYYANKLLNLGISKGEMVGIYIDRSCSFAIAMLAILKLGCTYVPIDYNNPKERTETILSDTKMRYIFSERSQAQLLDNTKIIFIDWSENSRILSQILPVEIKIEKNPSDVAYVIFTSGSTGKPKGVMLSHRNVTELFKSSFEYFKLQSIDNWSVFHSFAFDFSVWEIWGAFLTGSKATIVSKESLYDPKKFLNFLSDENITILSQTPSVFRNLLLYWNEHEAHHSYMLRYIVFGGESLENGYLLNWYKLNIANTIELINMYGTTEAAVHVTFFKLNRELICKKENHLKSFIGKPLSHLKILIMNDDLKVIPKGSCGEICIVGTSVALGYLNRSEQTALKFVNYNSEKLYRTGDLGKINNDEVLEYLGRKDGQIKLRGFRIEVSDIYNNVMETGFFQDCYIKLQDYKENKSIVCYFVKKSNLIIDIGIVNRVLKSKLPPYMIPANYIELVEIPTNVNGKIDHHVLNEIYLSKIKNSENSLLTKNIEDIKKLENSIKNIWESILNVNILSVDINFFDLGGNSLLLVHLQSKLNALIGSDKIEVIELFKYPTIQSQVKYLESFIEDLNSISVKNEEVPVSYGQYSIWLVHQTEQENYSYNISFAFKVNQNLDMMKFVRSVSRAVNRYPILSSQYMYKDQNLTQKLNDKKLYCDMQTHPDVEDKKGLQSILTRNSRYRYNLAKDELLRLHIIATPKLNNESYVQFVVHHIVMDMRSMQIFIKDIFDYFSQTIEKEFEKDTSYYDFIRDEKEYLNSDNFQKSLSFYRDRLFSSPPEPFLIKPQSVSKNEVNEGKKQFYTLSEKLTNAIIKNPKNKFNILLSSYFLALNKKFGNSDLCINVPSVNRMQDKYKNTVGYFHDPCIYRVKIPTENAMQWIINEIEKFNINEIEYGHVPNYILQSEYRKTFQHNTNNLNYTLFVYYDEKYTDLTNIFHKTDECIINDGFYPIQVDNKSSLFNIGMQVFENKKNIVLEIQYNSSFMSERDVKDFIGLYEQNIMQYLIKSELTELNSTEKKMDFSLFYFASNENNNDKDIYNLLFSGSKFADENKFAAIWVPERHFHPFGGIYPNASLLAAAIAVKTKHIQLRSGSCVLPLHHPARVAEEWSVVDNLSNGRVALSFAPGWNKADFIYSASRHSDRKEMMHTSIRKVQDLWRGEKVSFTDKDNEEFQILTYPRPVQKNLQIWLTAYGNPETFSYAGQNGFNVLTHLLGQDLDKLSENIHAYRESFLQNKNLHKNDSIPKVTVMLHTFLNHDENFVRKTVEKPFKDYIRSGIHSLKQTLLKDIDPQKFSTADIEVVINFAFERYIKEAALFGSKETVLKMINKLNCIGVDEIACLIDFGVEEDLVLNSLILLNEVKETFHQKDKHV